MIKTFSIRSYRVRFNTFNFQVDIEKILPANTGYYFDQFVMKEIFPDCRIVSTTAIVDSIIYKMPFMMYMTFANDQTRTRVSVLKLLTIFAPSID